MFTATRGFKGPHDSIEGPSQSPKRHMPTGCPVYSTSEEYTSPTRTPSDVSHQHLSNNITATSLYSTRRSLCPPEVAYEVPDQVHKIHQQSMRDQTKASTLDNHNQILLIQTSKRIATIEKQARQQHQVKCDVDNIRLQISKLKAAAAAANKDEDTLLDKLIPSISEYILDVLWSRFPQTPWHNKRLVSLAIKPMTGIALGGLYRRADATICELRRPCDVMEATRTVNYDTEVLGDVLHMVKSQL